MSQHTDHHGDGSSLLRLKEGEYKENMLIATYRTGVHRNSGPGGECAFYLTFPKLSTDSTDNKVLVQHMFKQLEVGSTF